MLSTTESGGKLIPPPANFAGKANCPSFEAYQQMYQRSIQDPEGFWGEIADEVCLEQEVGQGPRVHV